MKKNYTIFALILCLYFAIPLIFGANKSVTAEAKAYFKFDNVSSVYHSGEEVVVGDANAVRTFDESGNLKSETAIAHATRICQSGSSLFALSGDKIYALSSGTEYFGDDGTITDFAFLNEGLFIARGNEVVKFNSSTLVNEQSYDFSGKVLSIVSGESDIFVAVQNGNRVDIFTLNRALHSSQIKIAGALAYADDNLYSLTKSGSVCKISSSTVTAVTSDKFVNCVSGQTLCYATDEGEVFVGNNLLLAQSSSEDGFYSSPTDCEARMGKAVICDYLNDRLVVISDKTEYFSFPRPKAVTINNAGEIIFAYDKCKIAKINNAGEVSEIACPLNGVIDDIYCDNLGSIFVVSGDTLYNLTENKVIFDGVAHLGAVRSTDKFFIAQGSFVTDGTSALFSTSGVIDALCVDEGNNFFYLSDGSLYRYDGQAHTVIESGFSNEVSVTLSRAKNGFVSYGDVIVCDSVNSQVKVINAQKAGSVMASAVAPDCSDYDERDIIRTTLSSCSIYATPNETDVKFNLEKDSKLIVAKYDILPNFSYVFYEDVVTKTLIRGYVFKSNLSKPLVYSVPPASEGKVYAEGTNVYALPSLNSEKLCENVPVDTTLSLLSFTEYSDSVKWYRVDYNGQIGYVISTALSVRHFIPNDERPQCDGVIIEYKGNSIAQLYELIDGQFVKLNGEFLLSGTEIDVVGTFDTSEKFTKIKYFDKELGTLTCYVVTCYVDYNSVSVVQIIALVIALVTTVLLTLFIVKIVKKHNRI